MWIETNLTDFGFYIFLNITVFLKFTILTPKLVISFAVSVYILVRIMFLYLSVYQKIERVCFKDNLKKGK